VKRAVLLILLALALAAATPLQQLDSQIVLERYELALTDLAPPHAMIFTYNVSQAGPVNIEQEHVIYRSGLKVRDETISVNGEALKKKIVRIGEREDRYAVKKLAPRSSEYAMLFLRTIKTGSHLDYEYQVTPLAPQARGFVVRRMIVDGIHDLPRMIAFQSASATAHGTGEIDYGPSGGHWVPLAVTMNATVDGKPARERITWSNYRFPSSLPDSTFHTAKPLPRVTPPIF
jgi:hypothetical protein